MANLKELSCQSLVPFSMSSFDTEVINFNAQWEVWKICYKEAAAEEEEKEAETEAGTEAETETETETELSSYDMSLSTLSASKCACEFARRNA